MDKFDDETNIQEHFSQCTISDRYEIQENKILGHGGMGTVYEAYDKQLQRKVALKKIRREFFINEAQTIAKFQHPNIVTIYDAGTTEANERFFVMELIDGETLKKYCLSQEKKFAKMPKQLWRTIAKVMYKLALAIDSVHERGIYHQDIKPNNIMVQENGEPKLLDFGIAGILKNDECSNSSTYPAGTPEYMSPEQLNNQKDIDRRTDIYSLGVTFYECLTKKLPYECQYEGLFQSRCKKILLEMDKAILLPCSINKKIPYELESICLKCLKIDISQRYQTADELAKDIQNYLDFKPISAKKATILYRIKKVTLRNRLVIVSSLCVFFIMTIFLFYFIQQNKNTVEKLEDNNFKINVTNDQSTDFIKSVEDNVYYHQPSTLVDDSKILPQQNNVIFSIAINPTQPQLASAGSDSVVSLWNTITYKNIGLFNKYSGHIYSVAFSPNGQLLAFGGVSAVIYLWDVPSQKLIASFRERRGHTGTIVSIAFSPDGKILASTGRDMKICIWDIQTQRLLTVLGHYNYTINYLIFSPTGILMSAGMDRTVCLWDINRRGKMIRLKGHSSYVKSITLSPDGKILASGGHDQTICLWSMESYNMIDALKGHSKGINSLAFHSDGNILASGSADNTIILWDIQKQKKIACLEGHSASITTVVFLKNSKILVSGGYDNTIRFWDIEEFRQINLIHGTGNNGVQTLLNTIPGRNN